jgi:SAM-dependent methyltransferase
VESGLEVGTDIAVVTCVDAIRNQQWSEYPRMMPSFYKRLLGRTARQAVTLQDAELVTFPIVRALVNRYEVSIVDFGCGLAQQSRALAEYLRDATVRVRLTLIDISTLHRDFLLQWGRRAGISTTFLRCTAGTPVLEWPECDLCLAVEFFEQVHDPVSYFNRMDAKLAMGGLLVTGIMDQRRDFMRPSPQLGMVRKRIEECGYETVVRERILRKGHCHATN